MKVLNPPKHKYVKNRVQFRHEIPEGDYGQYEFYDADTYSLVCSGSLDGCIQFVKRHYKRVIGAYGIVNIVRIGDAPTK